MIGLLGRLKREMIERKKFRNYLLYAFGEIVLVIAGILIALQIDNWHSDRQDQAALQGYLASIARNMSQDQKALENMRAQHEQRLLNAISLINAKLERPDVPYIQFASQTIEDMSQLQYFNPVTSGYQALRSSGLLGNLQGTDIERLVFDYYDAVDRILRIESDRQTMVRDLRLQLLNEYPEELNSWEFSSPESLTEGYFEELQPHFRRVLESRSVSGLVGTNFQLRELIGEYDKVIKIGTVFNRLVASGRRDVDEPAAEILGSIHEPSSIVGHPTIIHQGQIQFQSFGLNLPDSASIGLIGADEKVERASGWNYDAVKKLEDSLRVHYPGGAQWAALSLAVDNPAASGARESLDYSGFTKLRLELKGDTGGETFLVNLKDSDDPDDGSQTNLEVVLSNEWQVYEFDLERFDNAELQKLHVVLAFLFLGGEQTFFIRSATFI
jgi:hypothetical protein